MENLAEPRAISNAVQMASITCHQLFDFCKAGYSFCAHHFHDDRRPLRRETCVSAAKPAARSVRAFTLCQFIFTELREIFFARVTQHAVRRIALEVFRHLHALSLALTCERQTEGYQETSNAAVALSQA